MNNIPIQVTDEGVLIPKTYLHNASEVEVVATGDYFLIKPRLPSMVGPPPAPATSEAQTVKLPIATPQPAIVRPTAEQSPAWQPVPARRHPLLATGRSRNLKAAEAANILENEADRRNFTLQAAKQNKEFDLNA